MGQLNKFASQLREVCLSHPLAEKWVVAPSRRIGYQWLDEIARSGANILNARVKTMESLAMDLAEAEMARAGLRRLGPIEAEIIVFRVIAGLGDGYFGGLSPTRKLAAAVLRTLEDLRLAGLVSTQLSPDSFESDRKGKSLIRLLSLYEAELALRNLCDGAAVFRTAAAALNVGLALPEGLLVIMPDDMERKASLLERAMWEAFPGGSRVTLPTDPSCQRSEGASEDASLLAWVSMPSSAPRPQNDGSADMFRAVGEVNEVREVLRRCLREGIPFDEIEVLYSDSGTYLPLIYELCSRLMPDSPDGLPVTFHEGIPLRYSRPASALAGWLSFISDSYPQAVLVRLIQEGLLDAGEASAGLSRTRLAAELRDLPVFCGADRYLPAIDARISALERLLEGGAEDGNDPEPVNRARVTANLAMLRGLRDLAEDLLRWAPQDGRNWKEALAGVEQFLEKRARCVNELDEYARRRMLDEVQALAQSVGDDPDPPVNVQAWLAQLIRSGRVEGEGPRPGCIYAAPLHSGGHSGRPHIFILGLDEARFPGPGLQDPLLLDAERGRISGQLPTATERIGQSLEDFSHLAASIRGGITLSYTCRDIEDDRDIFPSQVILSAYHVLSGNKEGLMSDFLQWIPEPVSFAPRDSAKAANLDDWWLSQLAHGSLAGCRGLLVEAFPHLGRGYRAREAKESDDFTVYDGWVPQAGSDLDPSLPGGPVLSASRLEKLARCPLEYFMQYVLGIERPDEHILDSSRWLEPDEKGDLLHTVFRRFHQELGQEGLRPEFERDRMRLEKLLEIEISRWRERKPCLNHDVFEAERKDLRATAAIFLFEEEMSCRRRKPLYFEAAAGLPPKGRGNAIDDEEAVPITLPDGSEIRVRGYIDRIDEAEDHREPAFALCDYKTGSSRYYEGPDIFRAGRRIQGTLYLALAESLLAKEHHGARALSFEYFFPNTREHGRRISRGCDELNEGLLIIARLCEMLRLGCFPLSENPDDLKNSDYLETFGDIPLACASMKKKMINGGNEALLPFAILRGYREE
jgi:hypothetical protein